MKKEKKHLLNVKNDLKNLFSRKIQLFHQVEKNLFEKEYFLLSNLYKKKYTNWMSFRLYQVCAIHIDI